MDPVLAEAIARRIAAWMETGAFHARNEEYWRNRALNAEADTAPQPRQWQGLTDEEINHCVKFPGNLTKRDGTTSQRIARAIEAKLKEKNT